jgi:phosphoribosylformylglycinamidine cyclo-ligase
MTQKPLTYKDAGVDIDAGNRLVDRIKPSVARTLRPEAMGNLGGFGGLFAIPEGYRQPVLVAGTDGVGTKLKLAMQYDAHDNIGIDLVAMCVNDVIVQGAEPLFFLDYYATGSLNVDVASRVVDGIARGCEQSGMTLLGGETAEMPGMYSGDDYDLAGFCVGVVERDNIIDGSRIDVGDQVIGISASGPHSNGFSLIRRILEQRPEGAHDVLDGRRVIDLLLEPTRLYPSAIGQLNRELDVLGLAHITGGGLLENIPRVLPANLEAHIYRDRWQWPAVFDWLQTHGNVAEEEMLRTFNCGVGMVVVVKPADAERALDHLTVAGQRAFPLGEICAGQGGVVLN